VAPYIDGVPQRILVVEDDATIAAALADRLRAEGFDAEVVGDGLAAVARAEELRPDLVLLDVMLPGLDGLEVCRRLQASRYVPVLMLTARDDETDVLVGLGVGADDYITKPFSTTELLARIRAALRRATRVGNAPSRIELGPITLDLSGRTARGPAGSIHLTPLEYRLVECLARSAGMIVTQKQLLQQVWGPERVNDARGLRSYVRFLRQKLEPDPGRPRFIVTEAGIGYRLQLEEYTEQRSARIEDPAR